MNDYLRNILFSIGGMVCAPILYYFTNDVSVQMMIDVTLDINFFIVMGLYLVLVIIVTFGIKSTKERYEQRKNF